MASTPKSRKPSGIQTAWAAFLSLIFLGLGQVYAGSWRLGILLLTISLMLLFGALEIERSSAPTSLMFCGLLIIVVLSLVLQIGAAIDAARRLRAREEWSKVPWFRSTWCVAIVYLILISTLRAQIPVEWHTFFVPSGSNVPTVLVGDEVVAVKTPLGTTFQPGDIVVFRPPGEPDTSFIKRIIGLPGDTIQMTNGQLYINGAEAPRIDVGSYTDDSSGGPVVAEDFTETLPNGLKHAILKETDGGFANNTPVYTVPAGDLFMMGDNRDDSEDSRFLDGPVGYVPFENVSDRVTMIDFSINLQHPTAEFWYWPAEIRWDRLLKPIS